MSFLRWGNRQEGIEKSRKKGDTREEEVETTF